jgi:hypothetical protein
MSDAEALAHEIEALTAIQRNAWRELAGPTLTTFDRREIRNRIRQAEVDLRHFSASERNVCAPGDGRSSRSPTAWQGWSSASSGLAWR